VDDVEKIKFLTLPGFALRPLGCPARSHGFVRILFTVSINVVKLCLKGILCSLEQSECQVTDVTCEVEIFSPCFSVYIAAIICQRGSRKITDESEECGINKCSPHGNTR
jgi:hypothetical protein